MGGLTMQNVEINELSFTDRELNRMIKPQPVRQSNKIWHLAARSNAKPMVIKVNGKILNKTGE